MQQLKKWSQNEKEFTSSKKEKTLLNEAQKRRRESGKGVVFVSSVMLLEAAARNDIDEGEDIDRQNVETIWLVLPKEKGKSIQENQKNGSLYNLMTNQNMSDMCDGMLHIFLSQI